MHYLKSPTRYLLYFYTLLICLILTHTYSVLSATGIFNYVFVDYRVWYSLGQVISKYGYDQIYDVELLRQYQQHLVDFSGYRYIKTTSLEGVEIFALPYVYPSIFSIPFTFTGYLPLQFDALMLCAIFNVFSMGLLYYLHHTLRIKFNRTIQLNAIDIVALSLVSTGSYFSLLFLNPSILLSGFCSLGLILHIRNKHTLSGLTFSLCFLKPNIAIWILLGLFITKQTRTALHMAIGGIILLLSSLILSGEVATKEWIKILIDYKSEYGNWPESMPNIRMIYIRIADLFKNNLLALMFSLTLALFIFWIFLGILKKHHKNLPIILLSCSILSVILSYHSHLHTLCVIIPFTVFYAYSSNSVKNLTFYLHFIPVSVFLAIDLVFLDLTVSHLTCSVIFVISSIICLVQLNKAPLSHQYT